LGAPEFQLEKALCGASIAAADPRSTALVQGPRPAFLACCTGSGFSGGLRVPTSEMTGIDATGRVADGAAFFAGVFGCCVAAAGAGGWAGIGLCPLWPGGGSG
jgi:hypothetical protein